MRALIIALVMVAFTTGTAFAGGDTGGGDLKTPVIVVDVEGYK